MSFKKFREISHKTGLMSAFVAFVAISVGAMSATPVHAVQYRFGDVDVQIDNIVSFGLSMRTASRELALLPARNGGSRKDNTLGVDLAILGAYGAAFATEATTVGTAQATLAAAQKALADNTDDGQTATLTAAVKTAEGALATAQTALLAKQAEPEVAGLLAAANDCGTNSNPSAYAQSIGSHCMFDNTAVSAAGRTELYNYDGSINTDDGRLNFDKDDLIGGTFKVTTELEAQTGDFTFFARVNAFYDAVLADDSNFARSAPLKNANRAQVYDIDMLDFYVDWSSEVANLPFTLRAGRQVINWGEATFILGGNSVFNPISVPAFRRPGSEIKEALLPVMAIYGSLSLPYDLTLEAYAGGWDSYDIDPGGGPFANSDSFELGSGDIDTNLGSSGNGARSYVGSGAYTGSNRRNCLAASSDNGVTALFGSVFDEVYGTCGAENNDVHFQNPNELGFVERSRQNIKNIVKGGPAFDAEGPTIVLGDTDFLRRADDNDPSDDGNYGISLRWYAENLNSTEFAIYYQNYTSRIPYAATVAYNPVTGPNVATPTNSSTLRGGTAGGCVGNYDALRASSVDATNANKLDTAGTAIPLTDLLGNGFRRERAADVYVKDPTGIDAHLRSKLATYAADGTATLTDAGKAMATSAALSYLANTDDFARNANGQLVDAAGGVLTIADGVVVDSSGNPVTDSTKMRQPLAINPGTDFDTYRDNPSASTALATKVNGISTAFQAALKANLEAEKVAGVDGEMHHTLGNGYAIGCLSVLAQTVGSGGALLPTGASTIATRYQIGLVAQYPEDIEVYGLSFNTTAFGWGVQGEIAYRDSMPLQLDTDALPIAAIAASCAWENFSNTGDLFYAGQTIASTCSNHGVNGTVFDGFVREEVYNIDIGTTATFTRSNPMVSALGADLGVFLTELGYVNVPNAEDYWTGTRLANQCTSGSDLPLGSVFALDPRTAAECRPTEESSGIVLFGYLQYNNVFGSAIGLRPTFAYQRGIDGRSPSPAGSFIEDNESLSLSVTAEYQAKWTASLGYTMYDGDVLYNRNVDRDYLSASVSYAF